MNVLFHKNFLKHFHLRIIPNSSLDKRFQQRLKLFLDNPKNSSLKDHALIGKKAGYRSFSITGNIRVVYKIVEDGIVLYDIGTHNQVY